MIWEKTFGGSKNDIAYGLDVAFDGGYILVGETDSDDEQVEGAKGDGDGWIVKTNNKGQLELSKAMGGSKGDVFRDVKSTPDGGYILAGKSKSSDGGVSLNRGINDYWVVKLDVHGEVEWSKTYGGSLNDEARSVALASDGGYVVTGFGRSHDGDIKNHQGASAAWVIKLDEDGNLEWETALGPDDCTANHIEATADGGYIIGGFVRLKDKQQQFVNDLIAIKINQKGELEWQKQYGGSDVEEAHRVRQTEDGGYIIVGQSSSIDGDITAYQYGGKGMPHYWILKIDSEGNIEWDKSTGGSQRDIAMDILITDENDYMVFGYTRSNNQHVSNNYGSTDVWIVKLKSPVVQSIIGVSMGEFNIYPNPSQGFYHFDKTVSQLQVVDVLGRLVRYEQNVQGVDLSALSTGQYFFKGILENWKGFTAKVIKE